MEELRIRDVERVGAKEVSETRESVAYKFMKVSSNLGHVSVGRACDEMGEFPLLAICPRYSSSSSDGGGWRSGSERLRKRESCV